MSAPFARGTIMSEENTVSIIEFSEDISTAEAPLPLPVGEYIATIEAVETRESAKGNLMIPVTFRISPDDYPADYNAENNPDGVTLRYFRLMAEETPRNKYNLRKFCEAIGAKMGKRIDPSEWLGLTAKLKIRHEKYEGEDRASIESITAA